MIQVTPSKLHWNYFLALERDLEIVSRYVEFCSQNFEVYSIEFAHLLFAAASEIVPGLPNSARSVVSDL